MQIGIVGLGYVGLPLAVAFAEAGHRAVGYDVDRDRVERLGRGESDVEDVPAATLSGLGERFIATADPAPLADCDAIVVCVPTPLAAEREPDLAHVRAAAGTVASVLRAGQLVVLESTTYPGTTREELLPPLEHGGLEVGRDFFLAYSPERIDPGRGAHAIATTPKVVGGLTPACLERAERLYAEICDEVVAVSSPEAAELSKLLENTFRSVNIALVNELAQLTDRTGVDIWEVIDAASTKPFGFMRFDPGPGMGGHCLPVDPFYLAFEARRHDFAAEFVELAGKINQSQPLFCVGKVQRALNDRGKPVKGSRVLLVGVAYKSGVADLRESPALKIIDRLRELGAEVAYHDPHVPSLPERGLESVPLAAAADVDAAAIVTAHDGVDYGALVAAAPLVVDFRGVTRGLAADNVVLL
ncbi:MAG: nucleotide sugar dehydrogenase [Acidobacteria bacterium]|nr:MAG: nucleotide sugar dehydrogenase [Acidobacteriota bacterium]GIK76364.1 MAG: UDP-N-acetyl-D-glucosamine dehydrogenase [Actinomycetes bacterium]